MQRKERDLRKLLEDQGFEILGFTQQRHWRIRLRKWGTEITVTASRSTSDCRSYKNVVSQARQIFNVAHQRKKETA